MPANNLCFTCTSKRGLSITIDSGAVLASSYQLEKYMKHTQPTWVPGINSLFDDPSTAAYSRYVVTSLVSGSVALDSRDRPTFIWYAGATIGATYENGVYKFPNDAVKVVLPYDATKIHAYSVSSSGYNATRCASCGAPTLG